MPWTDDEPLIALSRAAFERLMTDAPEAMRRAAEALGPEAKRASRSGTHRRPLAQLALLLYRFRRFREGLFPGDLFADPAWDILLNLYIAETLDEPVSVTSASIAAAAPPSTGLRYVKRLEEVGIIARALDPEDRRRAFLRLTPLGTRQVERVLAGFYPLVGDAI